MRVFFNTLFVALIACVSSTGYAQSDSSTKESESVEQPQSEGIDGKTLPPPRSYHEQEPLPSSLIAPAQGITTQAGVGGTQAYGRRGVLELGGSAGMSAASNFFSANISPSVGWFFLDNVEISAITNINYIHADNDDSFLGLVLAEPSVHLPFTRTVFGFFGVGVGAAWAKGPGVGFAVAPRVGMNIMVGRSGILTPALQLAYATTDVAQTNQGTMLGVTTLFSANIGYTVMW